MDRFALDLALRWELVAPAALLMTSAPPFVPSPTSQVHLELHQQRNRQEPFRMSWKPWSVSFWQAFLTMVCCEAPSYHVWVSWRICGNFSWATIILARIRGSRLFGDIESYIFSSWYWSSLPLVDDGKGQLVWFVAGYGGSTPKVACNSVAIVMPGTNVLIQLLLWEDLNNININLYGLWPTVGMALQKWHAVLYFHHIAVMWMSMRWGSMFWSDSMQLRNLADNGKRQLVWLYVVIVTNMGTNDTTMRL